MARMAPIQVLVVDDSAFMRMVLKSLLERDPDIRVIGTAQDGIDAVKKVAELRPDVVTMDVEMPRLDGLGALKRIMAETPCPVVMVSSLTDHGATATMQALELGAVDFVLKPSGDISLDVYKVESELISKVKIAAAIPQWRLRGSQDARLRVFTPAEKRIFPARKSQPTRLAILAASTGGPGALHRLLATLPTDFAMSLLIVQHMPEGFTAALADHLDARAAVTVREATAGDRLQNGLALVAPGGWHLELTASRGVSLVRSPSRHGVRPAVDVTLESIPQAWARRCVVIVLSGMGVDGRAGAQYLQEHGASVWAQDEASCVVFGMPRAVFELGIVERAGTPEQLGHWLCDYASGGNK